MEEENPVNCAYCGRFLSEVYIENESDPDLYDLVCTNKKCKSNV